MPYLVAVKGVVPLYGARNCFGVGIDEEFIGVKAKAVLGLVGPVYAVAVQLAGAYVGQIDVPHMVIHLYYPNADGFLLVFGGIKKTELYSRSVL
jgi:hypothetical protein